MSYSERTKIIVEAILEEQKDSLPPVDVEKVARDEGIEVIFRGMDGDISGMYVRREEDSYIFVNKTHSMNRQRFTIAHELGHHFLHGGTSSKFIGSGPGSDLPVYFAARDGQSTSEEVQANRFAAALLMPGDLIRRLSQKKKGVISERFIRSLAKRFKVSPQAMAIRLVGLGIIDSF